MTMKNMEAAVLHKAQDEADAILNDARQAAEARQARESARLREAHQRRVDSMKAEREAALERDVGARETEDRLKQLTVKNEIIGKVFSQAAEAVRQLPKDGYADWLKQQLLRVPKEFSGRVVTNEEDKPLAKRLLGELALNGQLSLSDKTARIKGGLLIEGDRVDLDFSVDTLLGALKESLAAEVAAKLFGDEAT